MRRRRAARAEVAGGRHHRLAEVVHPDPVDDDPAVSGFSGAVIACARSSRPLPRGNGRRSGPATTLRNCRGHAVARLGRIAAHENVRIVQLFRIEKLSPRAEHGIVRLGSLFQVAAPPCHDLWPQVFGSQREEKTCGRGSAHRRQSGPAARE